MGGSWVGVCLNWAIFLFQLFFEEKEIRKFLKKPHENDSVTQIGHFSGEICGGDHSEFDWIADQVYAKWTDRLASRHMVLRIQLLWFLVLLSRSARPA